MGLQLVHSIHTIIWSIPRRPVKKENEDLTNPVLDDDVESGSDGSPAKGMSLCSGKRPATELKPPARKRRAGDGLHG